MSIDLEKYRKATTTSPTGKIDLEKYRKKPNVIASVASKTETKGALFSPFQEGISGLKTLYGGGEQGIANKLKQNIQAGASDIQKGMEVGGIKGVPSVLKGFAKTGFRTAGDIAGAIYAPVGAAIGATGVNKVTDYIGEKIAGTSLMNKITDNPTVQKFAVQHPNAGEDFGRALNLAFAKAEKGTIEPKTILPRTKVQVQTGVTSLKNKVPDVLTKNVEQMRAEKIKSGYEEQNTRLKTVDKSFNENTKTYKNEDGTTQKVTPIETFEKHNITPVIDKGSIQMGSYKTGEGALGKIREKVADLDSQIDIKIKESSTGKGVPLDEFKNNAIKEIMNDPNLKRSGKVASTVKKLETVFEDYKNSYGDVLQETEINAIRKVMNADWSPETVDVSRVIGDTAREIVYNVTPDKITKTLLRQQGELLSAKKYAETLNGTKVVGGKLGNMALRGTGAIIGSTVKNAPVVGPVLGMLGGEYAARVLQQSQFKSLGAETKALFQRSNKNQPSNNAKTIPKSTIIPQINTKTNKIPAIPKSKSSLIESIKAQKEKINKIPNKQGGFIKIPKAKNVLTEEAKKYNSAEEFVKGQGTPKTVNLWRKSRFNNKGGYVDYPIIRKEDNIKLYQGGEGGQHWTSDKKYAEQFGEVKEKTGSFYQIDNGNRMTNVYVEAPSKSQLTDIWNEANKKSRIPFIPKSVKINGQIFKEIPDKTKQEMIKTIDYLRIDKKIPNAEKTLDKLITKYNINPDWSNSKIANTLEDLIEKTKTANY